jgi:hypothetical protein
MRLIPALARCGALVLTVPGWARERPFIDQEYDRSDISDPEPWSEQGFRLPDYPQEADLVAVAVGSPDRAFEYFLDARSLAVGADGVVRYTLVIRSPRGADNVSVEGLRCNEGLVRTYAYGGARGRLNPVPGADWEPIRLSGPYLHHRDLREFYLCHPREHRPLEREEILHRLREAARQGEPASFLP